MVPRGGQSIAAPGTRTRVGIAPGFLVGRYTNWAIRVFMLTYLVVLVTCIFVVIFFYSYPKGGRGCLMSTSCLESQGCHLIPLSYLLSCFFYLVLLLFLSCHFCALLTLRKFVSDVCVCMCRGAGWGVREAGWKHGWRVTSQRLL